MRSIPAAELDRIFDRTGRWYFRVEVERRTEAGWVNLGTWKLGVKVGNESPDQPVGQFSVRFLTRADGSSVSPGDQLAAMNLNGAGAYSPILYPGNRIRIDAANLAPGEALAAALWRRWLEGEIEDSDWPAAEVEVSCTTLDGALFAAMIEGEEVRGSPDPGTPVQDEIQGLANRWMDDAPTLYVPVDPAFNVGRYTPADNVGQQALSLAQRRGWDLRHRWQDSLGRYAWTLYLPPRDKTVPDLEISPAISQEVPGLKVSRQYVRNAFDWEYTNAATGKRETRTLDKTTSTTLAASEAQFGRRWMGGSEGDDSDLTTAAQVDALLGYAAHDLGDVHTERRERIPFCPWIELHDLIRIPPDGVRFTGTVDYAVVGLSHEVDEGGAWTTLELRGGSPVGQYFNWHLRGRHEPAPGEYGFINLRKMPAERPGYWRFEWETGSKVTEVWWGYAIVPDPPTADHWTAVAAAVEPLPSGQNWIEVEAPAAGQIGTLQLEPRYLDASGAPLVYEAEGVEVVQRIEVEPFAPHVALDLDFVQAGSSVDLQLGITSNSSAVPVTWEVREGGISGALLASGTVETGDARTSLSKTTHAALGGRTAPSQGKQTWVAKATDRTGLVYYDHVEASALKDPTLSARAYPASGLLTNHVSGSVAEPGNQAVTLHVWRNPDGATSATGEGAASGTIALPAGGPYTFGPSDLLLVDLPVHPGVSGVSVILEAIAADGRTTGKIRVPLQSSLENIFDELGEWVAGSIDSQLALAENFRGWTYVSSKATLDGLTPEQFGNTKAYTYNATTHVGQRYTWSGTAWVADNSAPVVGSWPIVEAGLVTAEVIAALAIQAKLVGAERLVADNLNIGALSLISNDVGAIVYGQLVSAAGTAGLNLEATGSQRQLWGPGFEVRADGTVILNHGAITLNADGTATFGGTVTSTRFTGANMDLEGSIRFGTYNPLGSGDSRVIRWESYLGTAAVINSDGIDVNVTVSNSGMINFWGETSVQDNLDVTGLLSAAGGLQHMGGSLGFFNGGYAVKPAVTGSRGGNAALADLLTVLSTYGLITNNTTA